MTKIKEMFNLVKGSLQSSKCTPGEYNFITASKDWKTHNEFEYDCEALIFAAAASGSLGRTHYVNGKFISSDLCFIITPKDEKKFPIDLKFYHIIFNTLKEDIVKNTKAGTSKEAIGLKALGEYELPYVDIDKQREISSKFNFATQISESFDTEITHQLDLIKNLRQAFLREAMQGLFVSNETSDNKTGADLLAEIQAEKAQLVKEKKIKKPKPLAPITEEELPFAIPENWTWCRLGEISYITSGSTPSSDSFVEKGIPYFKMYNLKNQKIDFWHKPQFIKEEVHNGSLKRCRLFPGDVIMNIVGPPLGKLAIIPNEFPEANFNQAAVLIRSYNLNVNPFIFWYLNEMSAINEIDTKGVAGQANISVTQAHEIKFPLPPLEIQERIVAKLDDLMGYCDALEEQVKQSQQTNELLLQQVLREALGA